MFSLPALALKYPRIAGFFVRFGKYLIGAAVIAAAIFAFNIWLDKRDDAAYEKGFSAAEEQSKDAMDLANKNALRDERIMGQMAVAAGAKAGDQLRNLTVKLSPLQKEVNDEISKNPIYRDCVITDGVFDRSNAGRAAVNASIDSGDTGRNGSRPGIVEPTTR